MKSKLTNYRTTLLLNGLIAVIFGLVALLMPREMLLTMIIYFGIVLIIAGAIGFLIVLSNMKKNRPYLYLLTSSIVLFLIGIFVAFYTRKSLMIFAMIIGVWAILLGIGELIIALSMMAKGKNRNVFLVNSLLTLVFGVILFFNPFETVVALVFLIGALAIICGAVLIYFSINLGVLEKKQV